MLIGQSDEMVITAGAGMGVDSGLTDFRSHDGFWKTYPALARSAMGFAEVASPFSFRLEPDLAWGFYGHRLDLYRKVVPHRGFEILRRWARKMARGAFVFTSNVDGQFQKAGFSEERIEEHHGSIHRLNVSPRAPTRRGRQMPSSPMSTKQPVGGEAPFPAALGAAAWPGPTFSCSPTDSGSGPGTRARRDASLTGLERSTGPSWSRSARARRFPPCAGSGNGWFASVGAT